MDIIFFHQINGIKNFGFRALSIADRGYVLETGKVVLSGTGQELLESEEVKKAYLGGLVFESLE
jgi:ABC-type branched-subunit amino acid transport system ATPase component